MRNLKRVLSLALALVMVLGMMVITTSAADFTDADEITQTEAVEVLAALGIVEGSNGEFNPNGTFNREAAAKLIAYMLGYGETAKKLSAAGLFTDVEAGRWSAGYIAFCASRGYIAGNGDGTFNPEGELTDIALGKLVLCALGADAEEEGYVNNDNWAANVSVDMIDAGLVGEVTGEAITREDACAMILNGMKAGGTTTQYYYVIPYGATTTTVNHGKFTNPTDAYVLASIMNVTPNTVEVKIVPETYGTLLEEVYDVSCTPTPDNFGRPATTYNKAGWIAPLVYTAEPTLTYTEGVKSSAVYNALGLKADVDAKWYINGKYDAVGTQLKISKTNATWKDQVIGGNGTTVEIYYNAAAKTITVVEVETFLAKVIDVVDYKAATATTDEVKASITIEVAAGAYDGYEAVVYTDGYAKNDYVIVTGTGIDADALSVKSIAPATTVIGKVDKYSATTATVDGTVYNKADCGDAIGTPSFTTEYKLYTDGTTVYAFAEVDPTIPTNYVYVVNTEYQAGSNTSLLTNRANAAKANVFFADGTKAVIDLTINTKNTANDLTDDTVAYLGTGGGVREKTVATCAGTNDGKYTIGTWFAYEVEEDGTYTLSEVDTTYATVDKTVSDFAKDTAWSNGGKYMTSATVVTAVTAQGKVTSFTGLPADAVDLSGANVVYTYAPTKTTISNIYIFGADLSAAPATAYAFAAKQGDTTAKGTEWTLYVGGETVTYVISGDQPTAGYVYTLNAVTTGAAAGTYTLTSGTQVTGSGSAAEVTIADESYFVAGSQYYYAKDYAVYNVATGMTGTADTIEVGDTVVVAVTSSSKAVLVYIVAEAE